MTLHVNVPAHNAVVASLPRHLHRRPVAPTPPMVCWCAKNYNSTQTAALGDAMSVDLTWRWRFFQHHGAPLVQSQLLLESAHIFANFGSIPMPEFTRFAPTASGADVATCLEPWRAALPVRRFPREVVSTYRQLGGPFAQSNQLCLAVGCTSWIATFLRNVPKTHSAVYQQLCPSTAHLRARTIARMQTNVSKVHNILHT